jgi:transposase InsO family protein
MKKTYRIAPEVKEQILKRIKEEGTPVSQAKEHGLNPATIYNWLGKGVKGTPTIGELVYEIHRLVWDYNHRRIHSALKMPPALFSNRYQKLVGKVS